MKCQEKKSKFEHYIFQCHYTTFKIMMYLQYNYIFTLVMCFWLYTTEKYI